MRDSDSGYFDRETGTIDDRVRWWPAEPIELTYLPPVIRDVWSDDPDRLTRRGVV